MSPNPRSPDGQSPARQSGAGHPWAPGDWNRYRAVLFDLDGVLTDTASIHSRAWKTAFDTFLAERAAEEGTDFAPFEIATDYLQYVDGRPRYEGVDRFLRSRGIELQWGNPEDSGDEVTVCSVGNRKNALVGTILREQGVEVYPGSLALVQKLAEIEMPLAVVTSSANAEAVLKAGGISDYFPVLVDGNVATRLELRGKPNPDPFLEAARQLNVGPSDAVVIEDAISGIEAGRAGGFGLIIGVDRHSNPDPLLAAGAHLIVNDLSELL